MLLYIPPCRMMPKSCESGAKNSLRPRLWMNCIAAGHRSALLPGYLIGGGLMIFAAVVEWAIGVNAERKPLEEVATPLSALA